MPAPALSTERQTLISKLASNEQYDIAVIGGGATGLGIALDAAARGFKTILVESHDFAKGTSSRSTKLVHGGVRYLAQGNIALVREALHERTTLLNNAPHLAQPLPFIMPSYRWWETAFYGIGLKIYDALAGKAGLGKTQFLSVSQTITALPNSQPKGLTGGVKYWDGQFNDAKLSIALARTAAQRGALVINYCKATQLSYEKGKLSGFECQDIETKLLYPVRAKCVINATGVWVDALRLQDASAVPNSGTSVKAIVAPSQGVHIVVDQEFLQSDYALMIPKTSDGRVLFAVPWLGKVILGTTDTPRDDLAREPLAFEQEISFILDESARYLKHAPKRSDVKSIWVGLRPLVKPPQDDSSAKSTKSLSREHTIVTSATGLVTVTGGKWTTYRAMAQDVLAECFEHDLLPIKPDGITVDLKLIGAQLSSGHNQAEQWRSMSLAPDSHSYGNESELLAMLPGYQTQLAPGITEAMVRFAARHEYARTVEDMLARRSRLLFLDARLAQSLAVVVGEILLSETGVDPQLSAFLELAKQYQLS
jgi:glycerol-3-phosphate dehydrogenase